MATTVATALSITKVNNNVSYTTITNSYTNSSSTTYDQITLSTKNSTGTIYYYDFDFDEIPSNAIITNVVIKVKAMVNSATYVTAANVQAYKGSVAVGSSTSFRSTSATAYTLNSGSSWSRDDLDVLRIYFNATRSNRNNSAYMRIYGMDVTVTWELPPEPQKESMVRMNGQWCVVTEVRIRMNGQWVTLDPEEYEDIFSSVTNLVRVTG